MNKVGATKWKNQTVMAFGMELKVWFVRVFILRVLTMAADKMLKQAKLAANENISVFFIAVIKALL